MYNSVICSPFVEHPFVDVAQFEARYFEIALLEEGQVYNL